MLQMGRTEEALQNYTKALQLDARNASSYNSRGLALDRFVDVVVAKRARLWGCACLLGGGGAVYIQRRSLWHADLGASQAATE